jgi:hypothetical protein
MLRKLVLLVFFLFPLPLLYAAEPDVADAKPMIGSIDDDSGRVNPDEFDFSNAEHKLWMDKHLLNIDKPARLHYVFAKTGSYEEGFTDDVYLDVVRLNADGTRDTVLDFFSFERQQTAAADNVTSVVGNPVIGIYLQGDVYEMNRLTGGHWKYFQRQLKLAMADSNESEDVIIDFNGSEYNGQKIVLWPFENVSRKHRLKQFSEKRYEFILSDDIPGKLYQIRTAIVDQEDPNHTLIEEVLTLANVSFSQQ